MNTIATRQQPTAKVLIADPVGLKFDANGKQNIDEVRAYIESKGGRFHEGSIPEDASLEENMIHFSYQPDLSTVDELLPQTDQGQYDAVIAAATFLPEAAVFRSGGVRIGAGTGNMQCTSWGGGNGKGGEAPLMNTPSFNSRATAQMTMKALLKVAPDLPVDTLHQRVIDQDFDTGKNLREYPTEKLEGKRIAILGFGNIGREVAKLAQAFGMDVVVHARARHQQWCESEGYHYVATMEEAAIGADVITPHLGLGNLDADTGKFANEGLINDDILSCLNDGAIVLNYDRGEIVDAGALGRAMASGKVRYASIDADIFKDGETGEITGPMVPYLALAERYPDQLELLPHAAADTEHVSRVEGAKQAVDQIIQAIQEKRVTNLKGDLPAGYTDAGAHTVAGVGQVPPNRLAQTLEQSDIVADLETMTKRINSTWKTLSSAENPERQAELIKEYGAQLILDSNRYATLMDTLGLRGPYHH